MRRLKPGMYSNCYGSHTQWHYLGKNPAIWLPSSLQELLLVFERCCKEILNFKNSSKLLSNI